MALPKSSALRFLQACLLKSSSSSSSTAFFKGIISKFVCQSLLSRVMPSVVVAKIWKCGQALASSVSSFNPVSVQSVIHR